MTMTLPRPSAVGSRPAYLDNLFRDSPTTPSVHSSTSSISTSSTASSYDLRSAYHASGPLSPRFEEDRSDSFSTRSKKSYLKRKQFNLGSVLHRRTYPQADEIIYSRPKTSHPVPSSPPPPPISSIPTPRTPPPSTYVAAPRTPPNDISTSSVTTTKPSSPRYEISTSSVARRPSLPRIQTDFPPPREISTYAKKALPPVPGQPRTQAPLPPIPGQTQAQVQPQSLSKTAALPPPPPPPSAPKAAAPAAAKPQRPKAVRAESNASSAELSCGRCYYFAARNCQGYVLGGEAGDACETCLQAGYFGAK